MRLCCAVFLVLALVSQTRAASVDAICQAPFPTTELDAPAGYTLANVVLLTRHGDRTPQVPFDDANTLWVCDASPTTLVLSDPTTNALSPAVSQLVRKVYLANRQALPVGNCTTSELTALGASQLSALGTTLRARYIDSGALAPVTPETVYIRSTDVPRTVMSAGALVAALTGSAGAGPDTTAVFTLSVVQGSLDDLVAGGGCPAYKLASSVALTSAAMDSFMASQASFIGQLTATLAADNFSLPLNNSGYDWQYLMDNAQCKLCHGLPLPAGISTGQFATILQIASERLAATVNTSALAQLGLGAFAYELAAVLDAAVNDTGAAAPFVYFSAHDTTLALLLGGLGAYSGEWPPYASSLLFEVFASTTAGAPSLVRVLYNGAELANVVCPGSSAPSGLCMGSEIVSALRSFALAPDDVPAACIATPPIPGQIPSAPPPCPRTLSRAAQDGLVVGLALALAALVIALVYIVVLHRRDSHRKAYRHLAS